jgi:hypothetical protein
VPPRAEPLHVRRVADDATHPFVQLAAGPVVGVNGHFADTTHYRQRPAFRLAPVHREPSVRADLILEVGILSADFPIKETNLIVDERQHVWVAADAQLVVAGDAAQGLLDVRAREVILQLVPALFPAPRQSAHFLQVAPPGCRRVLNRLLKRVRAVSHEHGEGLMTCRTQPRLRRVVGQPRLRRDLARGAGQCEREAAGSDGVHGYCLFSQSK